MRTPSAKMLADIISSGRENSKSGEERKRKYGSSIWCTCDEKKWKRDAAGKHETRDVRSWNGSRVTFSSLSLSRSSSLLFKHHAHHTQQHIWKAGRVQRREKRVTCEDHQTLSHSHTLLQRDASLSELVYVHDILPFTGLLFFCVASDCRAEQKPRRDEFLALKRGARERSFTSDAAACSTLRDS